MRRTERGVGKNTKSVINSYNTNDVLWIDGTTLGEHKSVCSREIARGAKREKYVRKSSQVVSTCETDQ